MREAARLLTGLEQIVEKRELLRGAGRCNGQGSANFMPCAYVVGSLHRAFGGVGPAILGGNRVRTGVPSLGFGAGQL